MENKDLRQEAKRQGVKLWMLADELGIHESTLFRLLRHPLIGEKRDEVIAAINRVAERKAVGQ